MTAVRPNPSPRPAVAGGRYNRHTPVPGLNQRRGVLAYRVQPDGPARVRGPWGRHRTLAPDNAMATDSSKQPFLIERHGDIAVITPSPDVEKMADNLMEQAAQMVLAPLRADPPTGLVFDLS